MRPIDLKGRAKAIFGQRHVIYVENPKASTNNKTTKMSYQGQVIASLYENQLFFFILAVSDVSC